MSTDRLGRMRTAMFRMLAGVMVVDAIALAVWFFTDVSRTPGQRTPMLAVWLIATLAVVLPGLRAMRIARRS